MLMKKAMCFVCGGTESRLMVIDSQAAPGLDENQVIRSARGT
jgi:hypothetical protein